MTPATALLRCLPFPVLLNQEAVGRGSSVIAAGCWWCPCRAPQSECQQPGPLTRQLPPMACMLQNLTSDDALPGNQNLSMWVHFTSCGCWLGREKPGPRFLVDAALPGSAHQWSVQCCCWGHGSDNALSLFPRLLGDGGPRERAAAEYGETAMASLKPGSPQHCGAVSSCVLLLSLG